MPTIIEPTAPPAPDQLRISGIAQGWRVNIKKWIMHMLGAPIVKVELTEDMVDEAFDSAIRRFAQWGYKEDIMFFPTIPGQSIYDLTTMIPEFISVKRVYYSPSQAEALLAGFFSDFHFDGRTMFWYHSTYATMTDFYILNMYNEMYLRTIGNEGQYGFIGNKLTLSPTPNKQVLVGVQYYAYPKEQDIRRDEWIREWALTECKTMLGRVRSKMSSLPGPRGDITLDGDKLITEAREDQKSLLERLNEFVIPAHFITG